MDWTESYAFGRHYPASMDRDASRVERPNDTPAQAQARRRPSQQPQSWWKSASNPAVDREIALERFREIQDDVRRQEQNRWLDRHAKRCRFEFSAEQKHMLRQWFNALDCDGSGKISVEELEDPMLSIGIVSDKREIYAVVQQLDKDGSGSIDFEEFVEFLTPHPRNDKSEMGKHEQMFVLLTKKMAHQSQGFLGINTQLSMERRRFILEAITHQSSQSLLDDIQLLNAPTIAEKKASSPVERHRMRHQRMVVRQKKLDALETQNQVDKRFQALQEVLNRNSTAKIRGSQSMPLLNPLRDFSAARSTASFKVDQPIQASRGSRNLSETPVDAFY